MNLAELKKKTDGAIALAHLKGERPEDITVTLQIEREGKASLFASVDTEMHYGGGDTSGCVLVAWKE